MKNSPTNFRYGCVVIIGKPNVGKSTLLNNLLARKVAIVSDKPETTRHRILGILTGEDFQIAFIDTPGIHKPFYLLGEQMVKTAKSSADNADLILFVMDATDAITNEDLNIIDFLKKIKKPSILLINKIDLVKKSKLLPIMEEASKLSDFKEIFPLSALNKREVNMLLGVIKPFIPDGEMLYPKETVTDRGIEFLIPELIREKTLEFTREELPHSIGVMVEEFREKEDTGIFYIRAIIFVERVSQRAIVIGRKGSMLKEIGKSARKEIEAFLGKRVFLELYVKVLINWRKDLRAIKMLGYAE
ncbi:MAG: GTPase Era [Candidatus Omnitrophica bacterium]|nr:GTPase Era [Candidatus Omnitrophota bacterium]